MRVRATATASAQSNAIGQVELECTPAGLAVGLYGVGAYSEGYAPGALANGTRITVPYSNITRAHAAADQLLLELSAPGLAHDRLALTHFTAGPGVPPLELRRRRFILQFSALSAAVLAALTSAILAPSGPSANLAWGALGYGVVAALFVTALGFALDQRLFTGPPGEQETREAFLGQLELYFPQLLRSDRSPEQPKKKQIPNLAGLLPRTATLVGVTLAATVMTALITSQRLLGQEQANGRKSDETEAEARLRLAVDDGVPGDARPSGNARQPSPTQPAAETPPRDALPPTDDSSLGSSASDLRVERRCVCDRADSVLWREPIPKLSALLLEQRTVPRRTYLRTHLEVAVVNNSDTPIEDITVHVQFYEKDGEELEPTKERPLYFEGPLRPGEAIKWSTEARGTEFTLLVPDVGRLGVDGLGAATADDFAKLLQANHRPVRLHAARMLSYLGDARGREGALHLKEAMRAAEAPYLRRVLAATAPLRVCDVELAGDPPSVGVCVYNATREKAADVGLQLQALDGSLDASHPLAHPPALAEDEKVRLPEELQPESGVYVRVPIAPGFVGEERSLELVADRFDLLD